MTMDEVMMIPLSEINSRGIDPPMWLVSSLAERNLEQPVLLYRLAPGDNHAGKRYGIKDGERRVSAAVKLGWEQIKAIIIDGITDEDDTEIAEGALVCNLARTDNPMLDAMRIGQIGAERAAKVTGRTEREMEARAVYANLIERFQVMLLAGDLTKGAARELARLDHDGQERAYAAAQKVALDTPRKNVTIAQIKAAVRDERYGGKEQKRLELPPGVTGDPTITPSYPSTDDRWGFGNADVAAWLRWQAGRNGNNRILLAAADLALLLD